MRVSVVIPAYKAAETIRRAVDSVLAQTHPAHEIIIVDDGSPDHQVEVIQRAYGDREQVILLRQPNSKTAKARNTGLERATGDYIAFLDADDYWEPEKLAKQVHVFEQYPEVGIVAGRNYLEVPGKERTWAPTKEPKRQLYDRVLRVQGEKTFHLATMIWTGTVMIRRAAIGTEQFITGLEPAEDRDFWVRIVKNHAAYLLSEPLATAVLHPGSISRSGADRDCASMLKVVERHADLLGPCGTRRWRSHTLYRWAALDPNPAAAIPRLFKSFVDWPFPYGKRIPCRWLGRTKRLATLMIRLLYSPKGEASPS